MTQEEKRNKLWNDLLLIKEAAEDGNIYHCQVDKLSIFTIKELREGIKLFKGLGFNKERDNVRNRWFVLDLQTTIKLKGVKNE